MIMIRVVMVTVQLPIRVDGGTITVIVIASLGPAEKAMAYATGSHYLHYHLNDLMQKKIPA